MGEGVDVDVGVGDGRGMRARRGDSMTSGSSRCGAAAATSANFDENSPKHEVLAARARSSPNVAASQNDGGAAVAEQRPRSRRAGRTARRARCAAAPTTNCTGAWRWLVPR